MSTPPRDPDDPDRPTRPEDPYGQQPESSSQWGQPSGQEQGQQPPQYGQYGQPAPGYDGAGSQPTSPRNGMGIAALVLGILAILSCIFAPLAVPLGIVALILGVIGRGRAKRGEATNGGLALTGIILGVVGAVISIGIAIAALAGFSFFSQFEDCLDPNLTQAEQQQCIEERRSN